jgi:hypothetical protein
MVVRDRVFAAPGVGFQVVAYAASLTGSRFEIDQPDANMVVNTTGNLDWANVNDTKTQDAPTGKNVDSYGGGEKEDDVCPNSGTGKIPDNKADLRYFGVYQEAGPVASDPGFLHLFWTASQSSPVRPLWTSSSTSPRPSAPTVPTCCAPLVTS